MSRLFGIFLVVCLILMVLFLQWQIDINRKFLWRNSVRISEAEQHEIIINKQVMRNKVDIDILNFEVFRRKR